MRFWRLMSPDYTSDYMYSYINGSLDYPFGLPGVHCDVCGETWGGSRVLPYEYPESLRTHPKATDPWPIPRSEHSAFQKQVLSQLGLAGEPFVDLRPGDSFQPCYLDVPSRPRADFLWSNLGVLVVSERIKESLLALCRDEIAVRPIILRKVGKREAKLPVPMPRTGEPENIIEEVPLLSDKTSVGPYHQVLPLRESDCPRDRWVKSVCAGCHRVNVDDIDTLAGERVRMTDDIWRGDSIFYLATTLYIIVTDEIKEGLSRVRPTNVTFADAT